MSNEIIMMLHERHSKLLKTDSYASSQVVRACTYFWLFKQVVLLARLRVACQCSIKQPQKCFRTLGIGVWKVMLMSKASRIEILRPANVCLQAC
jgi:hypothetical protein